MRLYSTDTESSALFFWLLLSSFSYTGQISLWCGGSVGSYIFLSSFCQICYILLKRSDCAMGWAIGNQILIPAGARDFYFSIASRLVLGLIWPPVQCYWRLFPWSKAAGAWIWPCTSIYVEVKNNRTILVLHRTTPWHNVYVIK
jgi:hypothetical protein